MSEEPLDDLDRTIIYCLQEDARKTSASEIADKAGVSASTVRNRIRNLEESGILTGYRPEVNYEAASYQLQTLIVCTAPIPDREALAQKALEVSGVVAVREVMTGTENVHVEAMVGQRRPQSDRPRPRRTRPRGRRRGPHPERVRARLPRVRRG